MHSLTVVLSLAAAAWPMTVAADEASVPSDVPGDVVALAPAEATPAIAATSPVGPSADLAIDAPPSTRGRWYGLSEGRHLGFQLDAGAPDGGGLSVLFRPWWWVRFNGGLAYNYLGLGIRGGVSFVPVHWAVTPSLSLDAGHYFTGDASGFASNPTAAERALLKSAGYDFASAQVGLEFGSQRSFSFYLRGGLVYLTATAPGANVTALATERIGDAAVHATMGDARLQAVLPCASLGMIFYVY